MASDINHVVILGRLTRDAELKYTTSGQPVCKFSIAVNRRKKQGEQWVDDVSFFDIVTWGSRGESLNQYLLKGKFVAIEGELRQERWEFEGQNRSKVEIVANNIQFLSPNPNAGQGGSYQRDAGAYQGEGYQGGGYQGAYQGGYQNNGYQRSYQDRQPRTPYVPQSAPQAPIPESIPAPQDTFADDIPF